MNEADAQSENSSFEELLIVARKGDQEALGQLLQQHRNYLLLVINRELDPGIRGKLGSSDVVQESLLTAHQKFDQFHGTSKEELLAWLRKIAVYDLRHVTRSYKGTIKRQVDRERSLQINSSIQKPLVDGAYTPATNAMAAEQTAQLKLAVSELPADYQQVLRLHSWQQKDFDEIGKMMARSPDAARKLWTRAVLKLQEVLAAKQIIE